MNGSGRRSRTGTGTATPSGAHILLIHGWACPVGYWSPLRRRLEQQGHRVTAVTLPGYGSGTPPIDAAHWSVETVAQRLAETAGELDRRPVHLVGHSLGGSIAATIAARHPRMAASVTLLGMVPTPPSAATRERLADLFLNGPLAEEAIQLCLNSWYGEHLPADGLMLRAPFGIDRQILNASLLAALDGAAPDVSDHIAAPVQVLIGADDRTRALEEVRAYADFRAGIELAIVPGAGHMVHWHAPGLCAGRIDALIRRE